MANWSHSAYRLAVISCSMLTRLVVLCLETRRTRFTWSLLMFCWHHCQFNSLTLTQHLSLSFINILSTANGEYVHLSVCISVCLFVCLSVCLSVCSSDSVYVLFCLFVCLSVCLSLCSSDSVCLCSSVCLSVCLSVWLSVCLSVCLSDYLCVYNSVTVNDNTVNSIILTSEADKVEHIPVTTVDTDSDLEVLLDSQLIMSSQVHAVCQSAYTYLRQLRPVVWLPLVEARKTVVQAFVSCASTTATLCCPHYKLLYDDDDFSSFASY